MKGIEEIFEYIGLYDIYGSLLTDKQRENFELYYLKNLSVVEIANEKAVSRQGVFDALEKAKKQLLFYEDKLHIIKHQRGRIDDLKRILDRYADKFDDEEYEKMKKKILELMADNV